MTGSQVADVLLVAGRLSLLGAKRILTAIAGPATSALVRQRQRVLRRQLGTHLQAHQVRSWDAAGVRQAVQEAARVAAVHTALVVIKEGEEELATLMGAALSGEQADAGLVLLSDRAQSARQLACFVEEQRVAGRRTACLASPLSEVGGHLAALLHAPSLPAVTVLPAAQQKKVVEKVLDTHLTAALPASMAAVAALGRSLSRRSSEPRLREIPSLGAVRCARENRPMFALPPLGVLDRAAEAQLAALASRVYNPVFVVEATPTDSIKSTAASVVRAVLQHTPHGPYNLLGWRLSTVLALEVQRQLEAKDKGVVSFLVDGDVALVQQWASAASPEERVKQSLLGEDPAQQVSRTLRCSLLRWFRYCKERKTFYSN